MDLYRSLVLGTLGWSLVVDLAWLILAAGLFLAVSQTVMRRRLIV
ncbi:MAG: hypothetical protein Q7R39_04115 [Dehalococcoidia bacterium]|nr:hypothetical protein [Dehalococcoidia bacterium]